MLSLFMSLTKHHSECNKGLYFLLVNKKEEKKRKTEEQTPPHIPNMHKAKSQNNPVLNPSLFAVTKYS